MWLFPLNKRAASVSMEQQVSKVIEEVGELAQAVNKGESVERIRHEANDSICALEQLKRMCGSEEDDERTIRAVIAKGAERKDWL